MWRTTPPSIPPTARWPTLTPLVTEAKARGIRIVLDMVLNHTSTEHEWFRQSLNKESPYRQFYIWRDGGTGRPAEQLAL